jgi:hypothetical protein
MAITLLFTTNAHLLLVNGWFRRSKSSQARRFSSRTRGNMLPRTRAVPDQQHEIAGPVLACLFLAELLLGVPPRGTAAQRLPPCVLPAPSSLRRRRPARC